MTRWSTLLGGLVQPFNEHENVQFHDEQGIHTHYIL